MSEPIEIPQQAFDPKPLFPEFPGKDIVTEIREWVSHSPPWAWRGHTHQAPTGAEAQVIRYVADFQLPKGIESPCPCCTPRHPKFGTGFVAWFPETSCIRLMGRDCFRSLNPEGHDLAVRELDERTRREGLISYLTANIEKRCAAVEVLEAALPLAAHIDALQESLGEGLRRTIGVDLWQQVRDGGMLKLTQETPQGPVFVPYGRVDGYSLVDPARKRIEPSVKTAIRHFESVDLPLGVVNTNDHQRELAARAFQRGLTVGRDALEAITDCRKLVSTLSLATLRNWGAQPNSPFSLFARRDGLDLFIGKTEDSVRRFTLDRCIDLQVGALPDVEV